MFGRRHHHSCRNHPSVEGDTLTMLRQGEKAVLKDIVGGGELQTRLSNMGLRAGKTITKLGAMPSGGPITVECDGFRVALGRGIARRVRVERASHKTHAHDQHGQNTT